MAQAVIHRPDPHPPEHPVAAVVALITIVAAIVLIVWARLEVHGVEDIEAVLVTPVIAEEPLKPRIDTRTDEEREHEAAVVANRWAGGLSQ
jgi:hypothetical protein